MPTTLYMLPILFPCEPLPHPAQLAALTPESCPGTDQRSCGKQSGEPFPRPFTGGLSRTGQCLRTRFPAPCRAV